MHVSLTISRLCTELADCVLYIRSLIGRFVQERRAADSERRVRELEAAANSAARVRTPAPAPEVDRRALSEAERRAGEAERRVLEADKKSAELGMLHVFLLLLPEIFLLL